MIPDDTTTALVLTLDVSLPRFRDADIAEAFMGDTESREQSICIREHLTLTLSFALAQQRQALTTWLTDKLGLSATQAREVLFDAIEDLDFIAVLVADRTPDHLVPPDVRFERRRRRVDAQEVTEP